MSTEKFQSCHNQGVTQDDIDAWTMLTFVTGRPATSRVSDHVAQCPECLHRAATAWSLLSARLDVSLPVPDPDLGFLQIQV